VVGHVFPLDAVGDAHRLIEERRATGKVVLVP
jgi:NADPH2:quinone reductase